jgi:hypothetical protein
MSEKFADVMPNFRGEHQGPVSEQIHPFKSFLVFSLLNLYE